MMETRKHAILSASSSARWLNCPPSVRLTEGISEEVSPFALEGTDAHTLCEYKLKYALGFFDGESPLPTLDWYGKEMEECANDYVAFILEQIAGVKEPTVLIEQRLDYSNYVEGGYGTGDCLIIADGILHVIDFKYGRGIEVSAQNNSQMMLYGLGALEMFGSLFEIDDVIMTIYQPRRSNISTYKMLSSDLYEWANTVLAPIAKLAYRGEGEYKAGDHCQFCKVKATCRERANENMKLAREEFLEPALLTDDETLEILEKVDGLILWINDVKEYALKEAIQGKEWTGFKLVEGRSVRKYLDEEKVAKQVEQAGYDPYEKRLLGITEMQKRLGKHKFSELLDELLIKPSGKPTLVKTSDKRQEYNPAKADFMTKEEE